MTLTTTQIKRKPHTNKRTVETVLEGSGCFLITEPHPSKSKRFEMRMRYPFNKNGKMIYIPLGVWDKDIKSTEDAISKTQTIKNWSKINNQNPKLYFLRNQQHQNQDITLSQLVDSYLENHKKKVVYRTYETSVGRLNQILEFFGGDMSITEFYKPQQGKRLIHEMHSHIAKGRRFGKPAINHASKCRNLIKLVFQHAIKKGWWDDNEVNPAKFKLDDEGVGHIPKSNPTLKWDELPELFKKMEENSVNADILTQLATKIYFMSGLRVSALVSLEWEWYDSTENIWRIPPETTGLKRKRDRGVEHLVPVTPEMKKLMNYLLEFNGNQKYVFKSPEGKKYPHLNPETINHYLSNLGYRGRLTAHGWRDVIVTSGQEVGKFDRDILLRQIGHTKHKQGASGCYDNTEFLPERRKFLKWWSKELVNQGLKI